MAECEQSSEYLSYIKYRVDKRSSLESFSSAKGRALFSFSFLSLPSLLSLSFSVGRSARKGGKRLLPFVTGSNLPVATLFGTRVSLGTEGAQSCRVQTTHHHLCFFITFVNGLYTWTYAHIQNACCIGMYLQKRSSHAIESYKRE